MILLLSVTMIQAAADAELKLSPEAERLVEQTTSCIDEQIRKRMEAHLFDTTPDAAIAQALAGCSHLKKLYADPVLADKYFENLRGAYLNSMREAFASQGFAEKRSRYVIAKWRQCVTDKAMEWSKLKDEATTVARAAVTSCASSKSDVEKAVGLEFQAKRLAAAKSATVVEQLVATMIDVAVEKVISERAKQLSKP